MLVWTPFLHLGSFTQPRCATTEAEDVAKRPLLFLALNKRSCGICAVTVIARAAAVSLLVYSCGTTEPSPPTAVSVVVMPGSASLSLVSGDDTVQFMAEAIDANGNTITQKQFVWSSSDSQVVGIDATSGLATAVAYGSASIIATTDGVHGSALVTVAPPKQPEFSFEFVNTSDSVVLGDSLLFRWTAANSGDTTGSAYWFGWSAFPRDSSSDIQAEDRTSRFIGDCIALEWAPVPPGESWSVEFWWHPRGSPGAPEQVKVTAVGGYYRPSGMPGRPGCAVDYRYALVTVYPAAAP